MSEHSLLSPSAASRWMRCPASVVEGLKYPDTSSAYADEGTLAHDLAKSILKGEAEPAGVPEDMRQPVQVYVDTVRAMSQGAVQVWVEESLDLSNVMGVPDQKGTGDYIALLLEAKELQVHDLKYGKGVKVDAEGNEQLGIYGLGALDLVSLIYGGIEKVRLVIHQPRLNSVSEFVYTVDQLLDFKESVRQEAKTCMEIVETGCLSDSFYAPSEKACRWCKAKGACPALAAYCASLVVGDFDNLDDPKELSAEVKNATSAVVQSTETRLASLYLNLDLITKWVSAVKEFALAQMLNGVKLPGLKLVEGRAGNRKWADVVAAEEVMKSMRLKKEEMYNYTVISPTDAEKLLKSSVRKWNRVLPLITRTPPAPAIVPESDKRPELALNQEAEFEDLDSETTENTAPVVVPEDDLI